MNERIEKLTNEAIEQSLFEPLFPAFTVGEGSSKMTIPTVFVEKFAELVVKECARIARATPCPYTESEQIKILGHTWDMASIESGKEILKHFGVE